MVSVEFHRRFRLCFNLKMPVLVFFHSQNIITMSRFLPRRARPVVK